MKSHPNNPISDMEENFIAFFNNAITVLQTLVAAFGAGLGIWDAINLPEGYGNDNPGAQALGCLFARVPFRLFHPYIFCAEQIFEHRALIVCADIQIPRRCKRLPLFFQAQYNAHISRRFTQDTFHLLQQRTICQL